MSNNSPTRVAERVKSTDSSCTPRFTLLCFPNVTHIFIHCKYIFFQRYLQYPKHIKSISPANHNQHKENQTNKIYKWPCRICIFEMRKNLVPNTQVLSLFRNSLSINQLGNIQQKSTQKNMIKTCKMTEINA